MIVTIHPGAPPTCDVLMGETTYYGIRMVIGPNGWQISQRDLLAKMYP